MESSTLTAMDILSQKNVSSLFQPRNCPVRS